MVLILKFILVLIVPFYYSPTAVHAMQRMVLQGISVRPSVSLSVKRVYCN